MYMSIQNDNRIPLFHPIRQNSNTNNLPRPSTALNASIIGRIHNVKPGCGSCGRK